MTPALANTRESVLFIGTQFSILYTYQTAHVHTHKRPPRGGVPTKHLVGPPPTGFVPVRKRTPPFLTGSAPDRRAMTADTRVRWLRRVSRSE
jgi:hypothetical protein